jgi:hypothetical protein
MPPAVSDHLVKAVTHSVYVTATAARLAGHVPRTSSLCAVKGAHLFFAARRRLGQLAYCASRARHHRIWGLLWRDGMRSAVTYLGQMAKKSNSASEDKDVTRGSAGKGMNAIQPAHPECVLPRASGVDLSTNSAISARLKEHRSAPHENRATEDRLFTGRASRARTPSIIAS